MVASGDKLSVKLGDVLLVNQRKIQLFWFEENLVILDLISFVLILCNMAAVR